MKYLKRKWREHVKRPSIATVIVGIIAILFLFYNGSFIAYLWSNRLFDNTIALWLATVTLTLIWLGFLGYWIFVFAINRPSITRICIKIILLAVLALVSHVYAIGNGTLGYDPYTPIEYWEVYIIRLFGE